jgi:large conductance mechanosensitive channel
MIEEFKKFILRGNVVDLAVGIVIGAAFGAIVNSLVNDIIMPPIGLLLGEVNFNDLMLVLKDGVPPGPYATLALAQEAGAVVIAYGKFLNTIITFLIVGLSVFILIKGLNKIYQPKPEPAGPPTEKDCQYCQTKIPIKATRCPNCTSQL